jgi:hypothetical protein
MKLTRTLMGDPVERIAQITKGEKRKVCAVYPPKTYKFFR